MNRSGAAIFHLMQSHFSEILRGIGQYYESNQLLSTFLMARSQVT